MAWQEELQRVVDAQRYFAEYIASTANDQSQKGFAVYITIERLFNTGSTCLQVACNAATDHQEAECNIAVTLSALQTCRDIVYHVKAMDPELYTSYINSLSDLTDTAMELLRLPFHPCMWKQVLPLFDLLFDHMWDEVRVESAMRLIQPNLAHTIHNNEISSLAGFFASCLMLIQSNLGGSFRESTSALFMKYFTSFLVTCLPHFEIEAYLACTVSLLESTTVDLVENFCRGESDSKLEYEGKVWWLCILVQANCTSFGVDQKECSKSALLLLQLLQASTAWGDGSDPLRVVQFFSSYLVGNNDDNNQLNRFEVFLVIQKVWWEDSRRAGVEEAQKWVEIFVESSKVLPCDVLVPRILQAITRSVLLTNYVSEEDNSDDDTKASFANKSMLLDCLLRLHDADCCCYQEEKQDVQHIVEAVIYSYEMESIHEVQASETFLHILARHIEPRLENRVASASFMQLFQTLATNQPSLVVLYFTTVFQHMSCFSDEQQQQLAVNIIEFLAAADNLAAQQALHQFVVSSKLQGQAHPVVDTAILQYIESRILTQVIDNHDCLMLSKLLDLTTKTICVDLERWLLLYVAVHCGGGAHQLDRVMEQLIASVTSSFSEPTSPTNVEISSIVRVMGVLIKFLLPTQNSVICKFPTDPVYAQVNRCLSVIYYLLNITIKTLMLLSASMPRNTKLLEVIQALQATCGVVGFGIRQCVKLSPRKSNAPTALLAFSEAIQDVKYADQNLPNSFADYSYHVYNLLLPVEKRVQQFPSQPSDVDAQLEANNAEDNERPQFEPDDQDNYELLSSEASIPLPILIKHFQFQLDVLLQAIHSPTDGKSFPILWWESQYLSLTHSITALHRSMQSSQQQQSLTLQDWKYLMDGYMQLMSSATLKRIATLYEQSKSLLAAVRQPKRHRGRCDLHQYLGHHALTHISYVLHDPQIVINELCPSKFTYSYTFPEESDEEEKMSKMAFQVRRSPPITDPAQVQSQLLATANNAFAAFPAASTYFHVSKALITSIRHCVTQQTTIQGSTLEELFRSISSPSYQIGNVVKKSEDEDIFGLSVMQKNLQFAYLLLLKDATRWLVSQVEEHNVMSCDQFRGFMLYFAKDLMQSIIRGIPLINLKTILQLLYTLEQCCKSTVDMIEVSLQLVFCLPECLDVPNYLLTNLIHLSIRLSGSNHVLKFMKYLIRSASYFKLRRGSSQTKVSKSPSTIASKKRNKKKKGLLFFDSSDEENGGEEDIVGLEGQIVDVQQTISSLLEEHFTADTMHIDVNQIPKQWFLPVEEEKLYDVVIYEVLRYVQRAQDDGIDQSLDAIAAFRSSQKLHGIVQVLAYCIHPNDVYTSFEDCVVLEKYDSRSLNVLVTVWQNLLTAMLDDLKVISDQLLLASSSTVEQSYTSVIMPVLSYFQDPQDGQVKAYSRLSHLAMWLELVQVEKEEVDEEEDRPAQGHSFTDVYLKMKSWCYKQVFCSSNMKSASASKAKKSPSPSKDNSHSIRRFNVLLKKMELLESKLAAFYKLTINSSLALTPDFMMFAEAAQDTVATIDATNEELKAMKPTEATPTRKLTKNVKLKLFNGENESSVKSTPAKKKTNNNRLRSRNEVVDAWLSDEDGDADAYADLEDFLVF